MTLWKAWFDTRRRFWIALSIAIGVAIGNVLAWTHLPWIEAQLDLAPDDLTELARASGTFRSWIDSMWVAPSGGGLVAYLAMLIGIGGVLTERREHGLDWTLSLPVAHIRWAVAHVAVAVALTIAIGVAVTLIHLLAAEILEVPYPVSIALVDVLGMSTGAFAALGITLAISAATRNAFATVLIAVPIVFLLHQSVDTTAPPVWGLAAIGVAGIALSLLLSSKLRR